MKYLKIEVVRSASTYLYVRVDDDADRVSYFHPQKAQVIREAAVETAPNSHDWDDYGWEDSLEVSSVKDVSEAEAMEYAVFDETLMDVIAPVSENGLSDWED